MERDGRGWIMNLKGLSWEEPQGLCLKDCEDAYLQAERRRRALPEDRHHPRRPPIRVEAEGHVSPIAFYEAPELGSGLPDDGVEPLLSLPCLQADRLQRQLDFYSAAASALRGFTDSQ